MSCPSSKTNERMSTLALLATYQLREETCKTERTKESLAGHLKDIVPLIETGGHLRILAEK